MIGSLVLIGRKRCKDGWFSSEETVVFPDCESGAESNGVNVFHSFGRLAVN